MTNINVTGCVQNTGVFMVYIDKLSDYVQIVDKHWGSIKELNGKKAQNFIALYKKTMLNYTKEGTKENSLPLDSVLAGLYYSFD